MCHEVKEILGFLLRHYNTRTIDLSTDNGYMFETGFPGPGSLRSYSKERQLDLLRSV